MSLKTTVLGTLVVGCFVSLNSQAACFPPNKLHLNPSPLEKANINQALFNKIIDKAEAIYAPIVASHKAKLTINRLWKDNTVNASANQSGSDWEVNMYGGLARRPEITPDGFAMVVCHEMGHHLGGYSFYYDESGLPWASNEGQSDYFAAHACAKKMWKDEPELNAKARQSVSPFAKKTCDTNYSSQADRDICYRSSNAGLSLATLLAKLRRSPQPKFETIDPSIVDSTFDSHPEAQCRLDTYLAGAACTVPFPANLIPAKKFNNKYGIEAEKDAGQYSCLARDGWVSAQRPRCWFKPHLEFEGLIARDPQWRDASGNRRAEPGETLALNIPLTNKLDVPSTSVRGELFSQTPGVTVVAAKVDYTDIPAGTVVQSQQPFQVKIEKTFLCGRPFELLFRANSSSGARQFPIKWFVGSKVAADFILGGTTKDFEIPDAPSEGIAIPFKVTRAIVADTLALDLEVDGIYPGENEFSLRLPDGEEIKVDIGGLFESELRGTAIVKFAEPKALAGAWALNIRDTQADDTLTLKKFTLRAPYAETVSCSP